MKNKCYLVLAVFAILSFTQNALAAEQGKKATKRILASEPVCDTVASCEALRDSMVAQIAIIDARVQELVGNTALLGKILTNQDVVEVGITPSSESRLDIYKSNAKRAKEACQALHMRLPNIHELALAMNPSAVSESQKAGYNKIEYQNASQSKVFYYKESSGYKSPAGDLGNTVWSDSMDSGIYDGAYVFSVGLVATVTRDSSLVAVRCAQDR